MLKIMRIHYTIVKKQGFAKMTRGVISFYFRSEGGPSQPFLALRGERREADSQGLTVPTTAELLLALAKLFWGFAVPIFCSFRCAQLGLTFFSGL